MKKQRVSNAVIRRLPRYYRYLSDLVQAGTVRISSSALGESMGLTASQIRQDLSCFGEFGQQGYGYNVENLRKEIADILGMNRDHTAIILGVGNLGRALIENFHFEKNGFKLIAAFDIDPTVVGTQVGDMVIRHSDEMAAFMEEHKANVGILTVPARVASTTAEQLVSCGVEGIWNFTNVELNISTDKVIIENVHFADSMLALSYMISDAAGEQ